MTGLVHVMENTVRLPGAVLSGRPTEARSVSLRSFHRTESSTSSNSYPRRITFNTRKGVLNACGKYKASSFTSNRPLLASRAFGPELQTISRGNHLPAASTSGGVDETHGEGQVGKEGAGSGADKKEAGEDYESAWGPQADKALLSPKLVYQPPTLPKPLYVLVLEPEADDGPSLIRQCITQGLANAVMLKDSNVDELKFTELALELQMVCRSYDVIFFVESRIGVAATVLADGVQLQSVPRDREIPLNTVRNFLQAVRDDNGHGRLTLGRAVRSVEQAQRAHAAGADFVIVLPDATNKPAKEDEEETVSVVDEEYGEESDEWTEKSEDPLQVLMDIRRAVSCHVLVTHDFTTQKMVTANSVLSSGADGFEIPASIIRELLDAQARMNLTKPPQELPDGSRLWGAIALIAGGTVGAGIIALPVKTAAAGFIPSTAFLCAAWCYMALTAMLLVELSLMFGPGTNLVTMTQETLGTGAKYFATALYLFIYAATLTAYIAEGANLVATGLAALHLAVPPALLCGVFTALFGGFVFFGTGPTEKLNSACLAVAIAAYAGLCAIGTQTIQPALLMRASWPDAIPCLPIMVVAFTFHNIVPSLLAYLGSAQRVLQAVLFGSLLPLVLYLIWQLVILGTIDASAGLTSAADITAALLDSAGPVATNCVQVFSFFAIVTSFLGVALGCVDFLTDLVYPTPAARRQSPPWRQRLTALGLACVPPFCVAVSAPGIFYSALEFSGTFRLVLFGIIPALMVWRGRVTKGKVPWVPGGTPVLLGIIAVASAVIGIEWSKRLGFSLFGL